MVASSDLYQLMILDPQDVQQFFRLQRELFFFVNNRLSVIPENSDTPDEASRISAEKRAKIRNALSNNLDLIQAFVEENPHHIPEEELEIVHSWRHMVPGRYIVFRDLKNYTVFLTVKDPCIAFGVVALSQPFEDLMGPDLPVLVEAVLLPFRDKIVYDGLITPYQIEFGPGLRKSLNDSYKDAKVRHGIVTTLPMTDQPIAVKSTHSKPAPKPPSREAKEDAFAVITRLVDQFCKQHLNEEYAVLCRKMAEKLARKRPSPLLKGKPNAWASGIVRAVGAVNFLHDQSQTPYMRATDIDQILGTSPSSGAAKSSEIRKMLKLYPFDPNWSLTSRLDENPMVWMLEYNGVIVDMRLAPRELQELAFNQGMIPYIPADRIVPTNQDRVDKQTRDTDSKIDDKQKRLFD
jgi:Domain of unknown function (DUF6398)